jgi:hypothetical protein
MKKLLLVTVACAATALTGFAQDGAVNFNSRTVGAVVTDIDGNTVGAGFLGQLVWGTAADSLAPVGVAAEFYTGTLSSRQGTVSGGAVTIPGGDGIPGFMALIAWDSTAGDGSYEGAKTAGGQFGMSEVFGITPLAAPFTPPDLVGLTSFQLEIIPEPSTFALGLIGIGALMLRRRK